MTQDYLTPPTSVDKSVDRYRDATQMLARWGIGSSLLTIAPVTVETNQRQNLTSPGRGVVGGYFNADENQTVISANVGPRELIHESMHAFQNSLGPKEQAELQALIAANPPPAGNPTRWHPPSEGQGLPDYFDYVAPGGNWSQTRPDSEMFRSEGSQPWATPPKAILDFIRDQHPLKLGQEALTESVGNMFGSDAKLNETPPKPSGFY